jgi:hypothetical protein
MGWMNIFRSSVEADWADPLDATVSNGARYAPYHPAEKSGAAVDPCAEIPEEIKRRQTALLVNYVRALRAR